MLARPLPPGGRPVYAPPALPRPSYRPANPASCQLQRESAPRRVMSARVVVRSHKEDALSISQLGVSTERNGIGFGHVSLPDRGIPGEGFHFGSDS